MFESLSDKLTQTFRDLRGVGKISEANIDDACKQVRFALLEADVHFKVAKKFVKRVKEKALGEKVHSELEPAQQFIQGVHDELVEIMGAEAAPLVVAPSKPTVVMMVGLQGSGKTTTAGKISRLLAKKQDQKVLLVACDLQRPAAIDQLETLSKQVGVDFYGDRVEKDPIKVAAAGLARGRELGVDSVFLDTAGRLHIDEELMTQLSDIKSCTSPHEILLVVDAMTGQDAIKVAESFDQRLEISGVVLTKLDGDTRGGAALSIREVTGKPIKFVGMGEKLDQLTVFYPDRMASRILNMGDVLSLVEKVQGAYSEDEMESMQERMFSGNFNLQDFYDQMQAIKRMGPMKEVLKMIPGVSQLFGQVSDEDFETGNKELKRKEAIICSMTMRERRKPALLNSSRKKRIAAGSGNEVREINALLKEFKQMKKMMQQMKGLMKGLGQGKMPRMPRMPGLPRGGFRR
jgi:signal recognition particle subunit SRP54